MNETNVWRVSAAEPQHNLCNVRYLQPWSRHALSELDLFQPPFIFTLSLSEREENRGDFVSRAKFYEFLRDSLGWDSYFNNTLSEHGDVETHKAGCEMGLQSHIFLAVLCTTVVKYWLDVKSVLKATR